MVKAPSGWALKNTTRTLTRNDKGDEVCRLKQPQQAYGAMHVCQQSERQHSTSQVYRSGMGQEFRGERDSNIEGGAACVQWSL